MNQKQQIKAGDKVVVSDGIRYFNETVIKVILKFDTAEGVAYNRICCSGGIYDERDGRCIAGDKSFKLEINKI